MLYNTTYEKTVAELKQIQSPVIDKCSRTDEKDGAVTWCSKVTEQSAPNCSACAFPNLKWRLGDCNVADHDLKTPETKEQKKKKVGHQKQSRKKKSRR